MQFDLLLLPPFMLTTPLGVSHRAPNNGIICLKNAKQMLLSRQGLGEQNDNCKVMRCDICSHIFLYCVHPVYFCCNKYYLSTESIKGFVEVFLVQIKLVNVTCLKKKKENPLAKVDCIL